MERTVCFTGHRQIPDEDYEALKDLLCRELEIQIQNGATHFRTGGALGFDTLAALTVLLLKKRYPQIRLELILPCPTQTKGWKSSDALLYEQILAQADSHRYVSQAYFAGVLQMRNRALVEGADVCIAYLCNSHGGGTAFTASLALKKGLEFINLSEKLNA
jgi:uncharacterized phage-like protein YoqJ